MRQTQYDLVRRVVLDRTGPDWTGAYEAATVLYLGLAGDHDDPRRCEWSVVPFRLYQFTRCTIHWLETGSITWIN